MRKGINAVQLVDEVLASQRFKITMDLYNHGDSATMRSLLIELLRSAEEVACRVLTNTVSQRRGLEKFEMLPLLKHTSKELQLFNTYKFDTKLRDIEVDWYLAMTNNNDSEKEKLKPLFNIK